MVSEYLVYILLRQEGEPAEVVVQVILRRVEEVLKYHVNIQHSARIQPFNPTSKTSRAVVIYLTCVCAL